MLARAHSAVQRGGGALRRWRFTSARNAGAAQVLPPALPHADGGPHWALPLLTAVAVATGAAASAEEEDGMRRVAGHRAVHATLRAQLNTIRRSVLHSDKWNSPLAPGLARVTLQHGPPSSPALVAARRARRAPPDGLPLDATLHMPAAQWRELKELIRASGLAAPLGLGGSVAVQARGAGGEWGAAPASPLAWPAAGEVRITHTDGAGEAAGVLTVDAVRGAITLHVTREGVPTALLQRLAGALAGAWALRMPHTWSAEGVGHFLQAPLQRRGLGLAGEEGNPLLAATAVAAGRTPQGALAAQVAAYPAAFSAWLAQHAVELAAEWCYWRALGAALDGSVGAALDSAPPTAPQAADFDDARTPPAVAHSAARVQWAGDAPQREAWLGGAFLAWLFQHWAAAGGREVAVPAAAVPAHLTPWTQAAGFSPAPPHLRAAGVGFMETWLAASGARERSRSALLMSAYLEVVLGGDLRGFLAGLPRSTLRKALGAAGPTSPATPPAGAGAGASARKERDPPRAVVHGAEVPPELAELPCEVYTRDSHVAEGVGWDALAGYPAVRSAVEENILLPRAHGSLFAAVAAAGRGREGGAPPPGNCFLFAGPPGTGKTTTARIIAAQSDVPLVCLSFEAIASSLYGKSQKALDKVLRTLSALPQGAVLFVDEADTLFPHRGRRGANTTDAYDSRHLSIFLKWLEGIDAAAAARVTVLLATNRAGTLDPALRSRVALTVTFDLPDAEARGAIWGRYAGGLRGEEREALVAASDGFSARDIRRAAELAERRHATALLQEGGEVPVGAQLVPPLSAYREACADKADGVVTSGGDGGRRAAVPRSGQHSHKV